MYDREMMGPPKAKAAPKSVLNPYDTVLVFGKFSHFEIFESFTVKLPEFMESFTTTFTMIYLLT